VIQTHATIGARILAGGRSDLVRIAERIARSHHERWDGAGYPDGLVGEQIPLEARIVAVADVVDALTCARPYRPAWALDAVRDLLRDGRGTHFDPAVVDALLGDALLGGAVASHLPGKVERPRRTPVARGRARGKPAPRRLLPTG
jgi:putative two-component system response regulator